MVERKTKRAPKATVTQEGPTKPEKREGSRPATNPDARENQLVNLAVSLAEKQLREGTASPSIINHYLKLASRREVLERELLEKNVKLAEAKADSIVKGKETEDLAKAALDAMKNYSSGAK